MHIAFYGSSLLSSYWNGAATYYRGLLGALAQHGHRITFYEPDAFEQLAESDLRDKLIAAISALPEREAQVIQLYYVEELNLEEIGQVLDVGAARVCQIKASAHARLKKAMQRAV